MSCDLVDSYRDAESLISYYQSTTGRSPDLLIGPMSSAGWGFLQFLQSRQSTIKVAFYTDDADRSRDDELCQTSGCLAILHAPFDETVKQVLRKNGFTTTAGTGTGTTSRGPGAPQAPQPGSASFGKTGSATSRFQRPAPSAVAVNPPSGFAPTVAAAPNPADTIPGFSPGTARFMAPAAPRSGALLLIDDDAGRVQELYSYLLEKQIPAKLVGSYAELETALAGGGFLMIIGPLYTEGVDLCRRIRAANPAGPQVVFYTNSSPHLQDARLPAQYGCLAIIPMPIPLGMVIDLVKAQTAPPAPSAPVPPLPVAQQQPNQRGTVMLTRPQPGARGSASYNASTSRNTSTARISQANLQPGDALGPPTGGQAPANSPAGAANVRNRVSVSSTQRPIQPMKSPPPWPTAPTQNEAPQWPAPAPTAAPQFPQPPQFTNPAPAAPAPQYTNPPQFPQFPPPAQSDAHEPDDLVPLPPAPQPLAPPVTATQARPPTAPVQTRPPGTTQQPARAIAPATSRVSRLGPPSAAGPPSAPAPAPATSRLARPPSVNMPAPPAAATPLSARPAPLPAKPLPAQPIDQTPDWMAEDGAAPARPASSPPAPAPTVHDDPHPAMTGTMRLRRSVRGPTAPGAQNAAPAAEHPAPPAPGFTAQTPEATPAPVATPRAISSPMPMAAPSTNFRPALPTPPASQRADDDFPFADEPTVSMPLLEAAEAEETRPEPDIVFDDAAPKVKTRQLVVVCARCGEDFIAAVPEGERSVACVNCGHINTTTG